MRRYIIFATCLIAFFGSLITGLALQQERDFHLRGYVDSTQNDNLPYRIPRLGVNADLTQYSDTELVQHLDLMQQVQIHWVRQFVYWDAVEPQQGEFEWSTWDRIFDHLDNYEIEPVIVLINTPQWARDSESSTAPPDNPTDFANFATAFATRFGAQVDYYQIWDEPNLDDAWGIRDPRPAEYAALLAEAHSAIHGVDAAATVMLAALAPTTELRGQNIADIRYLEDLYALGAQDYFDAVAAKPYGFDLPPNERTVSIDVLNFSRMIALREVMVTNDDGRKTLWASNWGWNHLDSDWQGDPSIWGSVSQQHRIDYTLAALQRTEREWPWAGGMILHHWQPNTDLDDPVWGFSLIDQDGNPTAIYDALKQRDTRQAASNGLYHPRTQYARYSGIWTFSDLGADIGWLETSDSQLEFDFVGTDIALWLREGDYFAFLYPTLANAEVNATPRDTNGNPYLLLRSATLEPELKLSPVARNLSFDPHTLQVIADRGWDQWALAGYAVSDGDLAAPYDRQLAWLAVATAISFVALLISTYQLPLTAINQQVRPVFQRLNDATQLVIGFATTIALLIGLLLTFGTEQPALFRRDLLQLGVLAIISGGLILLELGFLLTIVASLILFVIIYNRLDLGLTLILFYAPFFLFPVELYLFAFPIVEYLLLLTAAAGLIRLFAEWGRERQSANSDYAIQFKLHPMDYVVLAWVILATIALLWSERFSFAFTEWRTLFVEPAIFYVLIRTVAQDKQQWLRLLDTLLIAGVAVATISLIMFVRGDGIIVTDEGARRLAGVYGSPNNMALFLGRCVPIALTYFFLFNDKLRRIFAGTGLLVILSVIALTQSVGALLIGVPVAVFAIVLLIWQRKALPWLIIIGIGGVIVVLGLAQVSTRFANLLDLTSGTNFIRLRVWESTIEILSNSPLTGLGLDQFLYEYRAHHVRPDAIFDPDLSHPHNILLDFWIRLGVFGVGILTAMQVVFWRKAQRLYRMRYHDRLRYVLIIALMGIMVNTVAHGLVDNSVYVIDLAYIFVAILALMTNIMEPSSEN